MKANSLKTLRDKLKGLSAQELKQLAAAIQSESHRKQDPLRRERDRILNKITSLETQISQAKERLKEIQQELGESASLAVSPTRKGSKTRKGAARKRSGESGAREGSLRWHMADAAKAPGFPAVFTTHDLFEAIKGRVKAKSELSLWRQFVATLSRCKEFKNVKRGRGAKMGKWRLNIS